MMQASVQAVQHGVQQGRERGYGHRAEDEPDDKGMPLPRPEKFGGGPGMVANRADKSVTLKRHPAALEERVAHADEDEEQGELQRVDDVVGDLRGDKVEAQNAGDDQAGEGRRAEQRIDSDDQACGE